MDRSVAYVEGVFEQYRRHSGLAQFHGGAAEVGPGDNCGVGLLFRKNGCEQVDLVDRFYSRRSTPHHAQIYRALWSRHPELNTVLAGAKLEDDSTFTGLRRCYGEAASAERFFLHPTAYDVIVSTAVMEHVYDPRLALTRMAAALKPGGMLLHAVDLRDHLMFSEFFHELKFLEVPDWLYRWMTKDAGRPNRMLTDGYRAVMDRTGLEYCRHRSGGVPLPPESPVPGLLA